MASSSSLLRKALAASLLLLGASAQRGWHVIARDIGGSPLGVAFFEDALTGVTATSQLLPAGYETKRSLDGGATWATVPDKDLFIFALYNVAVSGTTAVVSAMSFVQVSTDSGANFTWASGAPAGGEIVRKLYDNGAAEGFAIMGETEDGSVNGFVSSRTPTGAWTKSNIAWSNPSILSIDGAFVSATSWVVVGNVYETAAGVRVARGPRRSPTLRLRWVSAGAGSGAPPTARLERTPPAEAAKASYATEVVVSSDGGATWRTAYSNATVAALGVACVDAAHCCFVGEDADYAFAFCTSDAWATVTRTLADENEGAALVEVAVAPGGCVGGGAAYVAVGGYVTPAGQAPVFYRSCDLGASWAKDPTPSWPVAGLLVTDVDCTLGTPNGTACWTTLWDDSGVEPNGFVARFSNE